MTFFHSSIGPKQGAAFTGEDIKKGHGTNASGEIIAWEEIMGAGTDVIVVSGLLGRSEPEQNGAHQFIHISESMGQVELIYVNNPFHLALPPETAEGHAPHHLLTPFVSSNRLCSTVTLNGCSKFRVICSTWLV